MSFNQQTAVQRATQDLANRLKISESEIKPASVSEKEFANSALGAQTKGEMAMDMISEGWQIELKVGSQSFEYRADKYQIRLRDFHGKNYIIES